MPVAKYTFRLPRPPKKGPEDHAILIVRMLSFPITVIVTFSCAEYGICTTPEILNRLFKIDNREQKKFLLAHRRSRRKVPYSADWELWLCTFSVVWKWKGQDGARLESLQNARGISPSCKLLARLYLCH